MSQIKPSSHGIVVEHKETGIHYAISDKNYDQRIHRKVRDLKIGESTRTYKPKAKGALVEETPESSDFEQTEGSPSGDTE